MMNRHVSQRSLTLMIPHIFNVALLVRIEQPYFLKEDLLILLQFLLYVQRVYKKIFEMITVIILVENTMISVLLTNKSDVIYVGMVLRYALLR